MSYRNPQQTIDNRNGIVTQGITKMLDATLNNIKSYRADEKKKEDKVASILQKEKQAGIDKLDKSKTSARAGLETQYSKAKNASGKFTSGLTDKDNKKTSDAVKLDEQVQGVLTTIGRNLNDELSNQDLTLEQIARLKQDAIGKMNNFTQDMIQWEAARQEYFLAKSKGADEVGALLTDPELQRNPELIRMFEAMINDQDDNLYITLDENGATRMSLGTITGGEFDARDSTDLTAWTRDHKDGPNGSYFETTEDFESGKYKSMGRLFEDLKDDKRFQKDGKLDKEELKIYFKEDPVGKNFASSFMEESKNKWVSLVGDVTTTYSDDLYLDTIVDRSWELFAPSGLEQEEIETVEETVVEETP